MSKISNLIFNNAKHYMSSPYGQRKVMNTSAGATSSFHSGTDYATNGVKLPQYAIEDGVILSCGKAKDGANFVWVHYPRINFKFLHYHLDSVKCKSGQSVKKGTLLGYTGKTGKATGIHLHLGTWDLKKGCYVDPEKISYTEPTTTKTMTTTANLNMRKTASKTGILICTIPKSKKVTYIANVGKKDGYTWYKIKYNGSTGYSVSSGLK